MKADALALVAWAITALAHAATIAAVLWVGCRLVALAK
jgi:hypothetical protein